MKKQPEITAATRAAFIEAYYDLIEKKAHNKITIQELANKAGYNRSTFYEYFDDINQLLTVIEDDLLECIRTKIISHFGNTDIDNVFIETFSDLYREYDKPLRLLFSEANAPHFSHRIKKHLIPIFASLCRCDLQNPETVFYLEFYLSGITAVITKWFSEPNKITLEDFAQIIKSIVSGMGKSGLLDFVAMEQ